MGFLFDVFRSQPRPLAKPAPEILDPEPIESLPLSVSPDAAPVHVLQSDVLVRVNEGRLRIEPKLGDPIERPLEHVSAVHLHGWMGITSPAVAALTSIGSPVVWRSPSGYPLAISQVLSPSGLEARRAQYRIAADAGERLGIARMFVGAKIRNMRGLLRRRVGKEIRSDLAKLDQALKRARNAKSLATLLGVEGAATAHYFGLFARMLTYRAPNNAFNGRTRRPPADVGNAALSYLYTVLLGDCVCALSAAGLDPREGFLHQPRPGRPALGLDFMEPFRPIIVDASVTTALNRGELSQEAGDDLLTETKKRSLLAVYEARMSTRVNLNTGVPATWRDHLDRQARLFASALARGVSYEPLIRS